VTAEGTVASGVAATLAVPAGAGGIIWVTSLEAVARGGGGGIRDAEGGLGECWALGKCCVSVIDPVSENIFIA
jgi:hypothetical protein